MNHLTPTEIADYTGKTQPAAQLRALRRMGIRAERTANPMLPVLVLWAWMNTRPTTEPTRPRIRSAREQAAQT